MANLFLNRALVRKGARSLSDRRKSVGHTRWGQAWLQPLQYADEQGRLARGLTYAQQGAVEGIVLADAGRLSAKVKGSNYAVYTIDIGLEPFTSTQITALLTEIARRPTWLDQLLSGRLPEGFEVGLSSTEIQLFPKRFSDLEMQCSCPDTAIPCKHQAAVLYQLAQHIDEEPMLLFTLRGLDFAEQLKSLAAVDGLNPGKMAAQKCHVFGTRDRNPQPLKNQLDFSLVSATDFGQLWRQLLPQKPAFFQGGDFAVLYHAYLQQASSFWSDYTSDDNEDAPRVSQLGEYVFQPWQVEDFLITLDAAGGFVEAEIFDTSETTLVTFSKEVALIGFVERLGDRLPVLAKAYQLARQLVQQIAVVPVVLQLDSSTYKVRWQAATQSPDVAAILAQFQAGQELDRYVRYRELAPLEETDDEYRVRLGREVAAEMEGEKLEIKAPDYYYQSPVEKDAVHALLSVFLRPMMLAGVETVFAKAEFPSVQLLFLGRPVDLLNTGDSQLVLALQLWLARLSQRPSAHRIVIQVEEVEEVNGAFDVRLLLLSEDAKTPDPEPITEALSGKDGEVLRLQTLRDVGILAELYPPLKAFSEPPFSTAHIQLRGGDFASFVNDILPALNLIGAQLLLPRGLEQVARPKLSAVVNATEEGRPEKKAPGLLGLKALVQFDWQVSIGNEQLTGDEFAALAENFEGIVRLRDGFVWLEAAQTTRLLDRLARPPKPSAPVVLQAVLTESWQGAPLQLSEEVSAFRQNLVREAATVEGALEGLQATLRPYQEIGFAWLLRNAEAGLGSLLADDMGLGKTLQTIALLEHYRVRKGWTSAPALIILPTSLITNWRRELTRFAPELKVAIYHGSNRKLKDFEGADVVLTSYGTARSDVETLLQSPWGALIIDEAQQIKNPSAAQTEAIKRLEAPIRIALSGTPVENRLSEYWSVLDFANPGYLGPLEQFDAIYAKPIEQDRDQEQLAKFRKVTAPFILRRLKTDRSVIKDLPEKITQIEYCSLAAEQAALYQQVVDTQMTELAAAEPHEKRGRILKFMTAVKQVCNHPHHYLKRGTKASDSSGKAKRMIELVEAALEVEERVLIFTQYREMGELISEMLKGHIGWAPPFLHGGLSRDERDRMVEGLQNDGPPILILSIKAGGTGLNLTAANHVIHYDLWWNPAVESQATDRAFRIGQQRNVQVHRLICTGTFEERIDMMLEQKRELADMTVGEGGAWLGAVMEEVLGAG
ncbi:MAG: SNF2-related protein [Saprospiraceae bacterium]